MLVIKSVRTSLLRCSRNSYFFFDSLCFTLNLTIFFTKLKGIGSSNGNWIVPFACLKGDNSFLRYIEPSFALVRKSLKELDGLGELKAALAEADSFF